MSRRKRHSFKCRVPFSVIESIADAMLGDDLDYLMEGYALQESSGLWRKTNGRYTVRLVYRNGRNDSNVFIFRNIAIKLAGAEA